MDRVKLDYGRLAPADRTISGTTTASHHPPPPSTRKRKLIILSLLSLALIIASAISAALLLTSRSRGSGHLDPIRHRRPSQAISRTCTKTRYPTLCVNSLTEFPGSLTANEDDLVHISFNMTLQHLNRALYLSSSMSSSLPTDDELARSAYDDCLELLDDSIDALSQSLSAVGGGGGGGGSATTTDVSTWLSAALTNQDTCAEGLADVKPGAAKMEMEGKLKDLTELISNCLSIFSATDNGDFAGVPIQNRRLLESAATAEEEGEEELEFPNWVGRRERRLLSLPPSAIQADIIVSADGNGTYKTIGEAIKKAPERSNRRTVIYVRAGRYEESNLKVGRKKWNLMFIGDGKGRTVITGKKSVFDKLTTFHTASFAATGAGFIARDMTFENTAGPAKHQAVALRIGADHAVIYRCNVIGYQDTLYVHSNRQFYRECDIYGTVDFIFGNAAVVLQNCSLYARKPMDMQKNTVTAQNRKDPNQNTGISIHASRILATPDLQASKGSFQTYLGRPWKLYSRTVVMVTYIGDHVHPKGWLEWNATFALDTLYYGEYMNYGPGAGVGQRVTWPGYIGDDERVEQVTRVPKKASKETGSRGGSRIWDREAGKPVAKAMSNNNTKKPATISSNGASKVSTKIAKEVRDLPVETCEGGEDMVVDDGKEVEVFEEASNATTQSVASDGETIDVEETGDGSTVVNQRIEEMELKIEKLEAELREVAALEISLYSVVPEHGSSAHKVHTPARRLSRLYIHAGKHWTLDRRATIAKNTVSGLVLISKSCGTDVPRLSFWLSNTIVLREIISQAFGSSCNSSISMLMKRKQGSSGCSQFAEDWQETGTFTDALEKVESWIFSRIVESVWWQALTPHMQPPKKDLSANKSSSRLLGPALGDQQQGNFAINLWKNAFQDAFRRICPVRAGGHECGCLPVVAKMVMEQCVDRLDVAMFNAILRESANEIPTDPVSDPIVDSRVLPIPAGDLSFGSGAQLKNSVGNWSRWLSDAVGIDDEEIFENDDDDRQYTKPKCFNLLNDLSDLLMLPKDFLADRSVRKEVCPSIGLPLVKRILCNFTPDEFCPDAVPGAVLEALNADSIVERKLSGESTRSFPYSAASVFYMPPSCDAVSEKVAEAGAKSQLSRNASVVQRKGYTSDDELEELDSPLVSLLEKSRPSVTNGNGKHSEPKVTLNARYQLLREVWSG